MRDRYVTMIVEQNENGEWVADTPRTNHGYLIPEGAVDAIIKACKEDKRIFKGVDRDALNRKWIEEENAKYEIEIDRANKEAISAIKERTAARRNKPGFVYLASDTIRGFTKIGYTENVKARIKQLKIANAGIEYLRHFDGTYNDEQHLHSHFKQAGKRISSEWFSLDNTDIESIELYFSRKAA